MINLYTRYAPRANPSDANYPLGSIKNESVPGAKDGTPLEKDWGNNIEGFHQALLAEAGIVADGQPEKVGTSQLLDSLKKITRPFSSIQSLLASSNLSTGNKVSTGSGMWKITTSTKGWPLANGLFAMPMNGIWVEDAGGDPLGNVDSSSAFDLILANLNIDTKRTGAICLGGGNFIVSKEISLTQSHSEVCISGQNGSITATSNVHAVISAPGITQIIFRDFRVFLKSGMTASKSLIHLGKGATSSSKITRVLIDNIGGGLGGGSSPAFITCTQMWESKIIGLRVDHDVTGFTGTVINMESCVNNSITVSEFGFSNTGIYFGQSSSGVGYKCEGILVANNVITYAKTAIKGDYITAAKIIGNILDFCENTGITFTNGHSSSVIGNWIANTSSSANGWNAVQGFTSYSGLKVIGNDFINNSGNTASDAQMNCLDSVISDNTSQGCTRGYRYSSKEISEIGNKYSIEPNAANNVTGSFSAIASATNAGELTVSSGISTNTANQLLNRIRIDSTSLNSDNYILIDQKQGPFTDLSILEIRTGAGSGASETLVYTLNLANGHIQLHMAGGGIVLTSPDGLVTKRLRLSNAGAIELV